MKAKIIKIGNSNGVIIPSSFLQELGLNKGTLLDITLNETNKELTIKQQTPRRCWRSAFDNYTKQKQDDLIFSDFSEKEIID